VHGGVTYLNRDETLLPTKYLKTNKVMQAVPGGIKQLRVYRGPKYIGSRTTLNDYSPNWWLRFVDRSEQAVISAKNRCSTKVPTKLKYRQCSIILVARYNGLYALDKMKVLPSAAYAVVWQKSYNNIVEQKQNPKWLSWLEKPSAKFCVCFNPWSHSTCTVKRQAPNPSWPVVQ